jgi:phage-related minor tail protein
MPANENITVSVDADTSAFDRALDELQKKSDRFGSSLTAALKGAAVSGRGLDDVLRGLAANLAGLALDAGMKPLQGLLSSLFSGFLGGVGVTPFAKGGVVSSPTYFGMGGNSLGLTGEAGAEAILPLARGADGRLGVAAGGGRAKPMQVVFNVSTPDAASFRKSEAQVSGMLARAARRGARNL